jgi:hypothetical protein
MKAVIDIAYNNTLEFANAIAKMKGIEPFDSAKVSGVSAQSGSFYLDCGRGEFVYEMRVSDHFNGHGGEKIEVQFTDLLGEGVVIEHDDWREMQDDEWASPAMNDDAFIKGF